MNDFLTLLQNKYGEKYNYIRVKCVEVFKQSKKVNITLYIPEDVFDYEFENDDIKAIKGVLEDVINGENDAEGKSKVKINLYFEKIYFDTEILKGALSDYIKAHYPYVGSNIDFERLELELGSEITINFVIQESVYDYASKSDFEESVKKFLEDKYYLVSNITYEIVENSGVSIEENAQSLQHRSVFIPVSDIQKICGKGELKGMFPKHIAVINKAGDNISICGKIELVDRKIYDETQAVEGKKFYKYHYILSVDDTSASMKVLYNTNEEDCPLEKLAPGSDIIVRGRVFYKENTGKFIMFAKGIGKCEIDFATVKAQLAPLAPPDEYRLPPKIYERKMGGYQMELDVMGNGQKEKSVSTGEVVAMHYLSIPKSNEEIIYEIACIVINDGKFTEYYHTYLKSPRSDNMNIEAKVKVMTAPRLSTVIPDLIKFTAGRIILALDVFNSVKTLNEVAKPLRYVFHNELKEVKSYGKKSKGDSNLISICRENGIKLNSSASAMEYAEAIGQLYLKLMNQ
ncbi:MAG: hypothetical protein EOM87_06520 [Clostridia bacterium]|nr:hypothetical protein [Clostridia bacterium]